MRAVAPHPARHSQPQDDGAATGSGVVWVVSAAVPQHVSLASGAQQVLSLSVEQQAAPSVVGFSVDVVDIGASLFVGVAPLKTRDSRKGRTMHAQLFQDHAVDLRRFLAKRLNDPRDADDLLQEVFLRAIRRPPAGDGRAWLFAVARNVLIDHYRRPRREHPSAEIPESPDGGPERPNPAAARAARCAAGLLHRLPDEQAEALRRVDMGASTQRLAAQELGVSVSGMKSRVQRGRAALRGMLQACCPTRTDARGGVVDMRPCERACGC